jgi:Kef-type K+ transport system membrane component KefB
VSFGVLGLIVLAGLAGPLLASARASLVPVVVGELVAGVVVGKSGFGWLDAVQPTTAFLGQVGFAMLMFTAGMHVPVRQPAILVGMRRGAAAAVVAAVCAVPAGFAVAAISGVHDVAVYALLLASGSTAILLPVLDDLGLLADTRALTLMGQVAIADVAAIVVLPLVLQPSKAGRAALGGVIVAGGVVAVYGAVRLLDRSGWVHYLRRLSKRREWALDLRLALLVLFALAWVAARSGTSVLVAGFGVGLVVAATGGPRRLSRQVTGIGQGFFVPLFFVVLGARLDLRSLAQHASLILLAVLLLGFNVAVHAIAALVTRQPAAAGLAATAQLGVPAAVVSVGLQQHLFGSGQGAAIIAAALGSLGLCSFGAARLATTRSPGGRALTLSTAPPTATSH